MTNASIYGQLIFDKSAKIIHVGKNGLTNKWCWQLDNYTQKNQGGLLFHIIYKNQLKIDHETIRKS